MTRRATIVVSILICLTAVLLVYEATRPKFLDFSPTYMSVDRIPYGTYVLYDQLEALFEESDVKLNTQSLIDASDEIYSAGKIDYILINDRVELNNEQSEFLLEIAERGGRVLIATSNLRGSLIDSLDIYVGRPEELYNWINVDTEITLTNPRLDGYYIYEDLEVNAITSMDTLNTVILGQATFTEGALNYSDFIEYEEQNGSYNDDEFIIEETEQEEYNTYEENDGYQEIEENTENEQAQEVVYPNFIEITYGQGSVLVHTQPRVFTNYHLLNNEKQRYVSHTLSYLGSDTIYYDDYFKTGRSVSSSPLRFILSEPALKWAWYLLLSGVLLYMIFMARRRQRYIPIVTAPENATLAFTRTISNMYFESGEYQNILEKKITYFKEYVRSRYYLNTAVLDDRFVERLSRKSGMDYGKCKSLVDQINSIKQHEYGTESQLHILHRRMAPFYDS